MTPATTSVMPHSKRRVVRRRVVAVRRVASARPEQAGSPSRATHPRGTNAELVAALQGSFPRPLTGGELVAYFSDRVRNPVTEQVMENIRERREGEKLLAEEAEARGEEWNG